MMWVYDIEMFLNLFVAVFINAKTGEEKVFEFSFQNDDRNDLIQFIKETKNDYYVGYNNAEYDDQMLYYIYSNKDSKVEEYKEYSNLITNKKLRRTHLKPKWQIDKIIGKSIDLMQIHNFGIGAKATSLKKIEFNFRSPSIQDLPFDHNAQINTITNIKKVIKYCIHDVKETHKLLIRSKDLIRYRADLQKLYPGIEIISDSEVTLAKKIALREISKVVKIPSNNLKHFRTRRNVIYGKDIVVPVPFKARKHKDLQSFYQNLVIKKKANHEIISLKNVVNYNTEYKNGLKCDYGAGGIHGIVDSGIYEADDEYMLTDADFGSFYPHLIERYGLEPKHIKKGVLGGLLMRWYNERQTKYPKKTHWTLNYGIKIIINLLYGQMGSKYSFLFDQQSQLAVCVNGMLRITMLMEVAFLNGAEVLYANTDGILIRHKKSDKDKIIKALTDYADEIRIPIEYLNVHKLIVNDVNNFLLLGENGYIKEKGLFETYETIMNHGQYHKDTSAMIIPRALQEYFVNGIPIEDTVYNANNIYDFCYGVKGGGQFDFISMIDSSDPFIKLKEVFSNSDGNKGELTFDFVAQHKDSKTNIIKSTIHKNERMLRYYISTEGVTLSRYWKETSNGGLRFTSVEASTPVTLAQNIKKSDIHDYLKNGSIKIRYIDNKIKHRYPNLDKEYYIKKCYEVINKIEKRNEKQSTRHV
jgi:hypothetical protein